MIDYTDAVGTAAEGAQTLADGASDLAEGMQTLYDGIGSLNEGLNNISENENVQKLLSLLEGDQETVAERAKAMIDLARNYTSYSGIAEGMTGMTQFIIKTAGI